MKGVFVAAAVAAMTGAASAAHGHHGHGHLFAKRNNGTGETCVAGCTTYWTTFLGEPTLVPEQTTTIIKTSLSTTTETVTRAPATTEVVVPLPTPAPHTFPTPGTYSVPATTIVVTKTTTVCGATSATVAPGTHTLGGVTTSVNMATTVVYPLATVSTSGTVTTSTILLTTYVCPRAGTYTLGPITTAVSNSAVVVYPTPISYAPGTYVAPAKVVTVTETDYVYYCPFTSSGLPTTTPAPVPVPQPSSSNAVSSPPQPSSSNAVSSLPQPSSNAVSSPPPAKPTTEAAAPPKSTETVQPKPQPQPPKGGPLGSNNDQWAMTYTPYVPDNGNCKSASQVDSDLAALKQAGFSTLRVYSTDCSTLENVGSAARKHGLHLIIGVFVKGSCSANAPDISEQINAIAAWAQWDIVDLIVVGNESIMNGHCSASQLHDLILAVKSKCTGYTGPYTAAEVLSVYQQPGVADALCKVIDVTGCNIHPYFNPAVSPDKAGEFVAGQLQILGEICPGKQAVSLETGWPTNGKINGLAVPGVKEQAIALQSIRKACGNRTVFFSPQDDKWKFEGFCRCEKSWGCAAAFGISI